MIVQIFAFAPVPLRVKTTPPNVESIIYNIANKLKIEIQLFDRSQGKIWFSPHAWVPVTQNLVVSVHLDAQICIKAGIICGIIHESLQGLLENLRSDCGMSTSPK
jgi:hypothetical protein